MPKPCHFCLNKAVKSKELDMKGAAELLGVSYGTLYGRYRENFGYLKHAWNISGRPQKKPDMFSDPSTKAHKPPPPFPSSSWGGGFNKICDGED